MRKSLYHHWKSVLRLRYKIKKKTKKTGRDNLQGEHLLYAHDKLSVMHSYALMFNAMFLHGHVPESFMDTIIIPLVKDKKESLQSSDNYRPIALTNTLSKVLEMIILKRHKAKLESSPYQFGYKPKHKTYRIECLCSKTSN